MVGPKRLIYGLAIHSMILRFKKPTVGERGERTHMHIVMEAVAALSASCGRDSDVAANNISRSP